MAYLPHTLYNSFTKKYTWYIRSTLNLVSKLWTENPEWTKHWYSSFLGMVLPIIYQLLLDEESTIYHQQKVIVISDNCQLFSKNRGSLHLMGMASLHKQCGELSSTTSTNSKDLLLLLRVHIRFSPRERGPGGAESNVHLGKWAPHLGKKRGRGWG